MKKVLSKLEFWFDYYFVWMFFTGHKKHRYIEYMKKKWKK